MATFLRASTAVEIKLGPFVDSGDGVTVEDGLTISQADVRLAKNDGDWAQKNESTTLVHEENGWYRCLLNTTDTNTVGILIVAVNESGALPVWREFIVLASDVYDALISGDLLSVNAQEIGASQDAADALAVMLTGVPDEIPANVKAVNDDQGAASILQKMVGVLATGTVTAGAHTTTTSVLTTIAYGNAEKWIDAWLVISADTQQYAKRPFDSVTNVGGFLKVNFTEALNAAPDNGVDVVVL